MAFNRARSWVIAALLFAVVGCGKKSEPTDARPEEPALSKPAPAPEATPTAIELSKPAPVAHEDAEKPVENAAPDTATDDDEDADDAEQPGEGKRKRGKSHKSPARRRSSSSSTDDGGEIKATASALRVKRIQFSEKIAGREPVDPEETFSSDTSKLFAFIELANETKEKTKVVVTFVPPMGSPSKVTLDVGDKSRWRTWAQRKSPKAVGTWKVIVKDLAGNELGHRSFEVTE